MSSTLQNTERDGILLLTLNRPEARNAMNFELATALAAAMDELDARENLRLGIITGAGGTFCAGMDLKAFLKGSRPSIPGRGFGGLTEKPPRKILIAAVEGYALAGGFELALACDLIVAADNVNFGLPEVTRGLVASAGAWSDCRDDYHFMLQWNVPLRGICSVRSALTPMAWSTD